MEAWNTVLFEKFSRFREIVTTGLGAHGQALIARHPPRSGARVLDVGCGFGDLTTELAARVGGAGQAVGVDAAARFVDAARGEASAAGVRNATFEVRDVEREPLGGPFQHAFSRFGTMFFASPVAALRNVARALAPDGELAMVVWRRREDNPWVHLAEERVRALVAEPEEHRAVTCGPGPFSMAGADLVSDQLLAAGFRDPRFERVDLPIRIGRDLDQAVEFGMALGPAGELLRLAGAEADAKRPAVIAALRDVFAAYLRDDGVWAPSSTWVISARTPG
ncbi:MAG: class I SAM-dependent methyltransferase [Deltaproteobacteria bacterium]|nr:class I SAM-dependent methyltransferase [Deltaproteobacteria bacterium]